MQRIEERVFEYLFKNNFKPVWTGLEDILVSTKEADFYVSFPAGGGISCKVDEPFCEELVYVVDTPQELLYLIRGNRVK